MLKLLAFFLRAKVLNNIKTFKFFFINFTIQIEKKLIFIHQDFFLKNLEQIQRKGSFQVNNNNNASKTL